MNQNDIKKILPGMFRQAAVKGSPLDAVFSVMEALHEKTEATLQNLDAVFDPLRTDDRFVPFLSTWVDLDWICKSGGAADTEFEKTALETDRFRTLIALAWYLSKWRGSAKGLILFLETATGVEGFSIHENIKDENGRAIPFHIEIAVPDAAADKRHLIERIIENEKPAYVTYTLC